MEKATYYFFSLPLRTQALGTRREPSYGSKLKYTTRLGMAFICERSPGLGVDIEILVEHIDLYVTYTAV